MRNAKLWSALLVAVLLAACMLGVLFTGASASDTRIPTATTTYVVGTDGNTIRACLDKAAGENWAENSVLEIQFTNEDSSIYTAPNPEGGVSGFTMFETPTIFRADDTKLPIVIRGMKADKASSIRTPANGYNAANDYYFTDLTIIGGSSGKSVTFYAGCGELVFENVHVENIAYTYFYGDCQVMDCFIGWTEEHVTANVNDKGLLETGMIFGEGCTGLNTADGTLPKGNDDMHIAAVGANSYKASIPVITGLKRTASTVTAPLTEDEVATVQAEAEAADFYPSNIIKENCILKPWDTSAYMILDCGRVATSASATIVDADYVYSGARKGISPVREARLELLSGGANYISADSHTSTSNETYVGDTKVIFRGGRSGYGDVGLRLTNHAMMVGNLTFEIHEDDAAMPTFTPWIQGVANSSTKTTRIFGDYHFLMTGGTLGTNKSSGANGYYGAPQATGKVVNEIRGGQLWLFVAVRYGGEFAEETPVSTVLPHDGTTLTAKVAVHNKISGGTFGGVDANGTVLSNIGFYAGAYDGGDANAPASVCNEITGGIFYRYAPSNRVRSNHFDSTIYNFISGTAEQYPTFRCNYYGAYATKTTKEVINVFKGYPHFEKEDGTKTWIYGGCEFGTVNKVTNYLGGMPVFDDFYGGSSGAAPTTEDGKVTAYNNAITKNIENHIALEDTTSSISGYIWGGNGYYGADGINNNNAVSESLVTNVYSGTYGTIRAESSSGTDTCDITFNVYGGTWKSNFMAVNRTYGSSSTSVKDYTVTTNIYDATTEAHMYMGGQNSRNQAIVNNIYGGSFNTKYTSNSAYAYYGGGGGYCMSIENNIYGGTFMGHFYGGGYKYNNVAFNTTGITNNLYGGTFGPWHDFMGAMNTAAGCTFPITNNFYGGDSGANWMYGGNRSGSCGLITNNFYSGADNPCRDPENALYKYFDASTMLEGGFKFRDQVIAASGYDENVYTSNTCTGVINNLRGGCWTKEGGSTTYITLHGGMRWGIINGNIVNNVITGKYFRIYGGSDYGVINGDIINNYGKKLAEGETAPELAFYNNGNSIGYIYGGGFDNVNFPSKLTAALAVEASKRTTAQKMYAAIAESLDEGETYNCSTGNITTNFYYGSFKQFFGGAYGLLTEGVTSNIASITNNVYGGTFDDTALSNGGTEHAYYGGCLRNCTIPGGITNNIYGGKFETNYYGGTPGSGKVVCPTIENNFYGGEGISTSNRIFYLGNGAATYNGTIHNVFYAAGEFGPGFDAKRSYVFCASANVQNDSPAEIDVLTEIYGGTFTGIWGVGGGSGTNFHGTAKTVVYGGTFNRYQANMPNAIVGATRNGAMNGDAILEIYGGTFDGDVVGGVIYGADSSAADVLNGNVTVNIYGGEFLENIYPFVRPGTNVTLAEGKTAVVNGVQTQGAALKLFGGAVFDTFTANGEAITIGEKTDLELKALTGAIAFNQTEGWQAHDYIVLPAGAQYQITESPAIYGAYEADDTILIKGVAVAPVGATLRLAERVGVRIVLNPDDVDAYGDAFTYTVTMGDTTIATGTYADIKANNYSILFNGIGLSKFGEKFTVSSPVMEDLEYSIVDLAVLAQTAWAENAKWKAYADAIIEFHNVYNLDQANTLTPAAVATAPVAAKGEADGIVSASATVLMSDAAGIRLTVELSSAPTNAKFVVGEHEAIATVEGNTISADLFLAHQALADEFVVSVVSDAGVHMTYTTSIEALANALATDDTNENKDNATAFLVYVQKAVACK